MLKRPINPAFSKMSLYNPGQVDPSLKAVTRVRIPLRGRLMPCRRFHLLPRAAVPRRGFSLGRLRRLPESKVVRFSIKGSKIFSSIMADCRLMT